MIRDFVNHLLI